MTGDRLLTPEEVSERLGVPTSWVYSAARAGQLPSIKLGAYRRFRWEAVVDWLEQQETGGAPRAGRKHNPRGGAHAR